MATPPDEIERQHAEAVRICSFDPAYDDGALANQGEIPHRYLARPTCELFPSSKKQQQQQPPLKDTDHPHEEKKEGEGAPGEGEDDEEEKGHPVQQQEQSAAAPPAEGADDAAAAAAASLTFPCWSSRGRVDVAGLQKIFREGYNKVNNSKPTNKEEDKEEKKKDEKEKQTTTTTNGSSTTAPNGSGGGAKDDNNNDPNTSMMQHRRKYSPSDIASTTDLWDPANAALNNVEICRPSHDAWGIQKVVLVFSDDCLLKTYEMPWWHSRPDIRGAVQPVLDALGIGADHHDRIARLLLASLPPGITIPVHHDTGYWVQYTHRCHVPVFVKDAGKVLFRCGVNDDSENLKRVECTPGHVFELNNQSKHAVSNCDCDHRVHMIVDYFDESYAYNRQPRIRLRPGEVLVQSRRTVDRLCDRGQRRTPNYLVLGAQKAGTTSLYEYLNQHPMIVPARRRETHCLDWRWNEKLASVERQREWVHKFYYKEELDLYPSLLTGDSTPSYLLDGKRVIPRLQRILASTTMNNNYNNNNSTTTNATDAEKAEKQDDGNDDDTSNDNGDNGNQQQPSAVFALSPSLQPMKFFVMLRDPVKRAESHYAMVTSPKGTEAQLKTRGAEWRTKTIQQVIDAELRDMKYKYGLIPYFDLRTGTVDEEAFERFHDSAQENEAWDKYMSDIPLNTGSHCLLGRGLYELNIRPWLKAFKDPKDFLIMKLENFASRGVNHQMSRAWDHLKVPRMPLDDAAPKNQREYGPLLGDETREYLRRFYEPHNRALVRVLRETYPDDPQVQDEWSDAWF